MSQRNVLEVVVEELEALIEPLIQALARPESVLRFISRLGWYLPQWGGAPPADTLSGAINGLADAVSDAQDAIATQSLEDMLDALVSIKQAVEALDQLGQLLEGALGSSVPPDVAEALALDLQNHLVISWLQARAETAYEVLRVLALIEAETSSTLMLGSGANAEIVRAPRRRHRLALDRLSHLLTDPPGTLREIYLAGQTLQSSSQARYLASSLADPLSNLVYRLGGRLHSGWELAPSEELEDPSAASFARRLLITVPLGGEVDDLSQAARLTLLVEILSAADQGQLGRSGPALEVTPESLAAFSARAGDWTLSLTVEGDVGTMYVGTQGFEVQGLSGAQLTIDLKAIKGEGQGLAFVLGADEGSRLEIGELTLSAGATLSEDSTDYRFGVEAAKSALVVSAGDVGSFLAQLMPTDDLRVSFTLGVGWSYLGGIHLSGGADLEIALPTHIDIGGVLRISGLKLALKPGGATVDLVVAADLGLSLGPLELTAEGVGLALGLGFPGKGGNLGPVDLKAPSFEGPTGLGLGLDAGPVAGGGHLDAYPDQERYQGAAQLNFENLGLAAVGVLETSLPEAPDRWSLLLLIYADFPPIELGFGFKLDGVGGLVGIHRTGDREALQAAVRGGEMGNLLFPKDPVSRADAILGTLNDLFPSAPDRFVFGPMLRLSWGTPKMITAELGVILDLPSPVKLVIVGRISADIPAPDAPLVRIRLAVAGGVHFGERLGWVDASLYDSRVGPWDIHGDMALRTRWGEDPSFLFSIGGWHPRFEPPADFPDLERCGMTAGMGPVRISLEAYLALTMNSFQVGSRFRLRGEIGPARVRAEYGFDVLFEWDPLRFLASIDMKASFSWKGHKLAGIALRGELKGPGVWHIKGRATLEVLIFEATVRVNVKVGEAEEADPPPAVRLFDKVCAALAEPRNWSTHATGLQRELGIAVRDGAGGSGAAHPLAELSCTESAAPLGQTLEQVGKAPIAGPQRIRIEAFEIDGQEIGSEAVTAPYPVGRFFVLRREERLSRPSFERFDAGARASGTVGKTFGAATRGQQRYQQVLVTPSPDGGGDGSSEAPESRTVRRADLRRHSLRTAQRRKQSRRQRAAGPARTLKLKDESYKSAPPGELIGGDAGTYTAAAAEGGRVLMAHESR